MKKTLALTILLSTMTLHLSAQVIIQDSFTYANGTLTNVSGNLWTNYSGAIDSQVNAGRLEVFGTRAGDVYRPFTNTLSSSVAYASFIVNATNVVSFSNYFAHFSANSTTFRGRVFAIGNQATVPNSWRLGITAAAGNTPQVFQLDLATNVDYRVVVSYDTVGFTGTLWVDPVDPNDPKKQTTDSTALATLAFFSFRQPGTTVSMSNMRVDDLYVGNSFADVNVGAVKPAVVYYQPPAGPTTNFVNGNMTLSCVGGGAGAVTFQWTHDGTNLVADANNTGTTNNILSLVNAVTNQSGAYRCIVTSTTNAVFASSVTSSVANVVITAAPAPPSFITQPVSQSIYRGQNLNLTTTVSSPGNCTFTWFSNNVAVLTTGPDSSGASAFVINNVVTNNSATYKVAVTNDVVANGIVSSNAVVTVLNPPAVSIAFLRTLVDPNNNFTATNSIQPYQVTGIVTTYTNLTSGNTSSYYLQDATAGINIFATFGSTFRPAQGDVVTFVGVLSNFNSGLELAADTVTKPFTSYSIVSNNFPLPAPLSIPFTITNSGYANMNTNIAGRLVQLTNVFFGTNAGNIIAAPAVGVLTVTVTNELGQPFNLVFAAQDLDTQGQTLPATASKVTGVVWGSQNAGNPNFAVAVTKFSDIVSLVAPIPLNVSFAAGTLTFSWANASFNLQSATNVLGPYVTIPGAATGFSTNTTSDQMYFRLFHP